MREKRELTRGREEEGNGTAKQSRREMRLARTKWRE